jgi:hypothetical protein
MENHMQKIKVFTDSNEHSSESGKTRMKALGLAVMENPLFELMKPVELPVDVRFEYEDIVGQYRGEENIPIRETKRVNVELKLIDDWWSSKATGHVGEQIMAMISEGCPGFVAVLGSLDEVQLNVPKVKSVHGNVQKRNKFDIIGDLNTSRALSGNAASSNVPVMFLSSNLNTSMKYLLSYVKDILTGPNFASFLPHFPVDPQGYCILCSIPHIGHETALGLLCAYEGIWQIANECQHNSEAIANMPINGKKLGRSKASKLIKAFGCEAPGDWI